ncbi:MAG: hypothetical protein GWP70_01145 [Proteobacteria bacterium]|nr:hypothetical protein [Pseudomonadota bacterium]
MRPPRALWVPFALGRPLGSADDPEFQKNVMRAAFDMLETVSEPTIRDYWIEAPSEAAAEDWVCPVSFAPIKDGTHTARLVAEVARLAPWSSETRATRGGRTLFGASGVAADDIETVAKALGTLADDGDMTAAPDLGVTWKFSMPFLVRHLADDMRTFYHEAIAAQPGPGAPNHEALTTWIFGADGQAGTALGDALLAIAEHLSADKRLVSLLVRGWMIPEGYFRGGNAFPTAEEFEADQGGSTSLSEWFSADAPER